MMHFYFPEPSLLPAPAIWLLSPSCYLSRAKGTNRSARSKSIAHYSPCVKRRFGPECSLHGRMRLKTRVDTTENVVRQKRKDGNSGVGDTVPYYGSWLPSPKKARCSSVRMLLSEKLEGFAEGAFKNYCSGLDGNCQNS